MAHNHRPHATTYPPPLFVAELDADTRPAGALASPDGGLVFEMPAEAAPVKQDAEHKADKQRQAVTANRPAVQAYNSEPANPWPFYLDQDVGSGPKGGAEGRGSEATAPLSDEAPQQVHEAAVPWPYHGPPEDEDEAAPRATVHPRVARTAADGEAAEGLPVREPTAADEKKVERVPVTRKAVPPVGEEPQASSEASRISAANTSAPAQGTRPPNSPLSSPTASAFKAYAPPPDHDAMKPARAGTAQHSGPASPATTAIPYRPYRPAGASPVTASADAAAAAAATNAPPPEGQTFQPGSGAQGHLPSGAAPHHFHVSQSPRPSVSSSPDAAGEAQGATTQPETHAAPGMSKPQSPAPAQQAAVPQLHTPGFSHGSAGSAGSSPTPTHAAHHHTAYQPGPASPQPPYPNQFAQFQTSPPVMSPAASPMSPPPMSPPMTSPYHVPQPTYASTPSSSSTPAPGGSPYSGPPAYAPPHPPRPQPHHAATTPQLSPHSPPATYNYGPPRPESQPAPGHHQQYHSPPPVYNTQYPQQATYAPPNGSVPPGQHPQGGLPGHPQGSLPPPLPPRPAPGQGPQPMPMPNYGGRGYNAAAYPPPPKTNYVPMGPQAPRPSQSSRLFSSSSAKRWLDKTNQVIESRLESVLQGPPGPPYRPAYAPPQPPRPPPGQQPTPQRGMPPPGTPGGYPSWQWNGNAPGPPRR